MTTRELDPYGDTLDLRALLQGLARSRAWIAALVLLGLVLGTGAGLVRPNQYASEGKIEVRLGARERRTLESSLDPASDALPAPLPGIGDEIELLDNPVVYERVAAAIGPERLLAPHDPAASDGPDTSSLLRAVHALQTVWFRRGGRETELDSALPAAARLVEDSIQMQALSGTSYLLVRAKASTPELAQLLTRTFVTTARQWHREVYSTQTELSFVSEQLARYEEEALAAERAYSTHRDECGFYDLEAQKGGTAAALAEHESRLLANRVRRFEVEEELAFVERELAATPATMEKLIPPSVKVNPEYQAALERIGRLNEERSELASVYTEGSDLFRRQAEQLDAEIARVEARLRETIEFIEYGAALREVVPNPRHEELSFRRSELAREKETLGRTAEMWERSKEVENARLRSALMCEPVHRDLANAVTRTKERVQQLGAAVEQAQALAVLDRQEDMDSLRIAQDGEWPRKKEGPDRRRLALLGLFGGLAVGLFLAALRYLLDPRIHDPETLRKELGLELIGVLPEMRRASELRSTEPDA
jgi:uncharacterized protein involved in exopolysaccharide biosynthesis